MITFRKSIMQNLLNKRGKHVNWDLELISIVGKDQDKVMMEVLWKDLCMM